MGSTPTRPTKPKGLYIYGLVVQLARAPDCLSGCCGFKPRRDRQYTRIAQLERASDSYPEGCRFDPGFWYHIKGNHTTVSMAVSKTAHEGSNPSSPAIISRNSLIGLSIRLRTGRLGVRVPFARPRRKTRQHSLCWRVLYLILLLEKSNGRKKN